MSDATDYLNQLNAANAEIHRLKQLLDLAKEVAIENASLRAKLNTPELHDFAQGVVLEAAHQRERWPSDHDSGKEPEDWFWLLGWLGGKAVHSLRVGDRDKALHHIITSAAALANWHAAVEGTSTVMRPGIEPPAEPAPDSVGASRTDPSNGCCGGAGCPRCCDPEEFEG